MNTLPRETRLLILKLICRHNGIGDIVDITGCSPTTIRSHVARMGEAAAAIHDRLVRGVQPERIELDELWSYIYCKRDSKLRKRDNNTALGPRVRFPPLNRGAKYTWVALDPDSKVVLSFHTGDRGASDAAAFLTDLSHRVVSRPLLTTDGHPPYLEAIQRAFGADIDHVVLEKVFKKWFNPETGESGNVLTGLAKIPQTRSEINLDRASTSHLERMNATIRNFNSRFTRQTYRFSKKLENHAHVLAIVIAYYNFVRAHGGFLKTNWKHCSPAMKAGVTDATWNYEKFLDQIDSYWASKAPNGALLLPSPAPPVPREKFEPIPPGRWTNLPFLVSLSTEKRRAKVHAAHCRDCRRALKGSNKGPYANRWYAFPTKKEALRCAEVLMPTNFDVCSLCILGSYSGSRAGRSARGRGTVN